MRQYYVYKYYFNAGHSFGDDVEKMHDHTFQLVLHIGAGDAESRHLFHHIDEEVQSYLSQYEGKYLNELSAFAGRGTSIEDIGEIFYDDLLFLLGKAGFQLYQLEVSENPLCVYIVSNQIMLHTRSDEESRQGIENILNRKKKLLSMLKRRDHDEEKI